MVDYFYVIGSSYCFGRRFPRLVLEVLFGSRADLVTQWTLSTALTTARFLGRVSHYLYVVAANCSYHHGEPKPGT
jgi:hypothetical protein